MNSQLIVPVVEHSQPKPRLVGYARVSTDDQELSLQIDALTKQGISTKAIFMDKVSGEKMPGQV